MTLTLAVSAPASSTAAALYVYINGSQMAVLDNKVLASGSNAILNGSVQSKLNPGDYLEVYAWFNNAVTLVSGSLFQITQIA